MVFLWWMLITIIKDVDYVCHSSWFKWIIFVLSKITKYKTSMLSILFLLFIKLKLWSNNDSSEVVQNNPFTKKMNRNFLIFNLFTLKNCWKVPWDIRWIDSLLPGQRRTSRKQHRSLHDFLFVETLKIIYFRCSYVYLIRLFLSSSWNQFRFSFQFHIHYSEVNDIA